MMYFVFVVSIWFLMKFFYYQLAVQAATGSERHIALQALMTLQQELCLSETEDDVFTGRLSRVITKLFARVIKAEEGSDAAYTQDRIDMESLICSIEDALTACQSKNLPGQLDATNVCIDMVTSLVQSIVGMYGGTAPLLRQMEDLGIDSIGSALGEIISTSLVETTALEKPNSSPALLSLISKSQFDIESTIEAVIGDSTNRPQPTTPSRDVASLVSRLGRAPLGLERESALEAIREFKATYGSEELDTHLQQLSGAFRDFILDQLKTDPAPQQLLTSGLTGTSVSDRIRNLRWRLQAADGPNQQMTTVVVEDDPVPAQSPPQPMPPASKQDENQSVQEAAVTTTLSAVSTNISKVSKPSPSKLAAPMQSRLSMSASSSSAQTLRERLAARHSSRLLTTTAEMVDSTTNDDATSSHGATSLGRAAALRARLEAVKHPV